MPENKLAAEFQIDTEPLYRSHGAGPRVLGHVLTAMLTEVIHKNEVEDGKLDWGTFHFEIAADQRYNPGRRLRARLTIVQQFPSPLERLALQIAEEQD